MHFSRVTLDTIIEHRDSIYHFLPNASLLPESLTLSVTSHTHTYKHIHTNAHMHTDTKGAVRGGKESIFHQFLNRRIFQLPPTISISDRKVSNNSDMVSWEDLPRLCVNTRHGNISLNFPAAANIIALIKTSGWPQLACFPFQSTQ